MEVNGRFEYDTQDFEQLYGAVHHLYSAGDYYPASFVAAGFYDNAEYLALADNSRYDDVYQGSAGIFGFPDRFADYNGTSTIA